MLPHSSVKGLPKLGALLPSLGLITSCVCRWFKFEEDMEDGSECWSKPYVSTLSLPSLLELRSLISSGTVLLDIGANSMEEIAGTLRSVSLWQQPNSAASAALPSPVKPCPNGRLLARSPAVGLSRGWVPNPGPGFCLQGGILLEAICGVREATAEHSPAKQKQESGLGRLLLEPGLGLGGSALMASFPLPPPRCHPAPAGTELRA